MLAHPSDYFIRSFKGHKTKTNGFQGQVMEVLKKQKFDRSHDGRIWGYGAKMLDRPERTTKAIRSMD